MPSKQWLEDRLKALKAEERKSGVKNPAGIAQIEARLPKKPKPKPKPAAKPTPASEDD